MQNLNSKAVIKRSDCHFNLMKLQSQRLYDNECEEVCCARCCVALSLFPSVYGWIVINVLFTSDARGGLV